MSPGHEKKGLGSTWSPGRLEREESDPFAIELAGKRSKAKSLLAEVETFFSRTANDEARARINDYQTQSKEAHRKLEEAYRLLQSDVGDVNKIVHERDRYKDILLCQKQKKLLASGTNVQATFSTRLEIQADTTQIVTVTVSEWAEDMLPKLQPHGHVLPYLVAQVFFACNDLIERRLHVFDSFLLGGTDVETPACDMDEETADFKREHLRRHYLTLFPLRGVHLQKACKDVIEKLGSWLTGKISGWSISAAKDRSLENSALRKVIEAYLLILVNTTLQFPPVVFAKDCGTEQSYDLQLHAESIDGDALRAGDKCVVVFPSLMEHVGAGGPTPMGKKFVLPAGPHTL